MRLKSLAGEPFVQFHRKGARTLFDEVIAVCRRAGFSPRIVNEPDFMATVLTLVESGLCVSIVPRCVASLKRPVRYSFHHPKVGSDSFVRCMAQVFRQSRRDSVPGNSESVATGDQKADGKNDPPIERSCLTKNSCNTKILGAYTARTQQRFSVAPAESSSG